MLLCFCLPPSVLSYTWSAAERFHLILVIFTLHCVLLIKPSATLLTAANKSSAIMSTHIVACLLLYRHRQVSRAVCSLYLLCTKTTTVVHHITWFSFFFICFLVNQTYLCIVVMCVVSTVRGPLCFSWTNVATSVWGLCPLQEHWCQWVEDHAAYKNIGQANIWLAWISL